MKHLLFLIPLLFIAGDVDSAEYSTPNFTVHCNDTDLAKMVGDSAEYHRTKHAKEWLGSELPGKWSSPCPIYVKYGNYESRGLSSFSFDRGHVFGWEMEVEGKPQNIVDSVIPHEVLHLVFASHFRRPLPRWADEGAATTVELESEKKGWRETARQVVGTQEQIPIRTLLMMKEYPRDGRAMVVLYAQGFYLSEFLINQKGKQEFVKFLTTYFEANDWDTAFKKHYGYQNQEIAFTEAYKANQAKKGESTPYDYDRYHIDVFTQNGCDPCKKWKNEELPNFIDINNIKFRFINLSESDERGSWDDIEETPAFIIYKNNRKLRIVNGYRTSDELLADCGLTNKSKVTIPFSEIGAFNKPKTVKAAQGIGIGYFGDLPGSRNRSNPHRDFSAAQMQIINQAIDSRSRVNIDNAIATKQDQLKAVIKAEIQQTILDIQSKLTDEQRALINATDDQKATLAGLKAKIDQVEAGRAEFIKQSQEANAEAKKQSEALAKEVEVGKQERNSLKDSIKVKVVEEVESHIPDKLTGVASAIPGAVQALFASGPLGLALYLGSRVLAARRKEDEPTTAKGD